MITKVKENTNDKFCKLCNMKALNRNKFDNTIDDHKFKTTFKNTVAKVFF